jgi:hypothetical protein
VGLNSTPAAVARSTPESQLVMSHAIATIAKAIDERILALPGSRDRLLPAIQHAIDYYNAEIGSMPGPIRISAQQHGNEPVPFALFPSAEDITSGLGRSIAVRNSINWFAENGHERIFAVMGTRQRPGITNAGWTDHTFRSLAASEQDARECLCEAAFTSLANAFANRLKERQREWRHLHANGSSQIGDGTGTATPPTTPNNGPAPEQLAIFSRHLDPAADALTAEDGLEALIEWLRAPEAQLRINPKDGQVAALPGSGGSVPLPLMSSTDRRHWLVCMTDFSLQEALDAIARTPAANRYILI